jgi:hypothetical protein
MRGALPLLFTAYRAAGWSAMSERKKRARAAGSGLVQFLTSPLIRSAAGSSAPENTAIRTERLLALWHRFRVGLVTIRNYAGD